MKKTAAWLAVHAMEELGIRFTFGIPGVHNTELYDEINKSNAITPVLVTHEGGAAFMADAVSRVGAGTVGALALDGKGHLAAGTSTGGMTNKRYGRVGDSPIIGAGTWADDRCAVSGTGWGEFYIRAAAAHEICARVRLSGDPLARSADRVINRDIPKAGGDGGAIALGADGSVAFPFNTGGMYRGWIGADGVPHVAIYKTDTLAMPPR